ncbi:MAG: hypothetical protein ETSY2_03070 [Candidatus Entotheonella gemina]|uniref:L-2-amino-thiazoline-4-carboxylic acid hydrolase n=1 Tax=Candidatus Entotheonella gemina TaxID=1429439 RepID=W4MF52_9BACT|nr:MAG: hypothetical protein ETSY2_03070 [Candidatus Entotheonella gemina]
MERSERIQWFLDALTEKLSQTLPDQATTLIDEIEAAVPAIRQSNQSRVVDKPSINHLEMTSLLLASYRVLSNVMSDRDAILDLMRQTMAEPLQAHMQMCLTQRFGIEPDAPKEAFEAAAMNFKQRGEQSFGKAFRYEQAVQTLEQSFVHIRRCFFNDFFRANDAPALTPLFCFMDTLWADALHKGEYNVRFERPTTLAAGDDMCRFQFSRE